MRLASSGIYTQLAGVAVSVTTISPSRWTVPAIHFRGIAQRLGYQEVVVRLVKELAAFAPTSYRASSRRTSLVGLVRVGQGSAKPRGDQGGWSVARPALVLLFTASVFFISHRFISSTNIHYPKHTSKHLIGLLSIC